MKKLINGNEVDNWVVDPATRTVLVEQQPSFWLPTSLANQLSPNPVNLTLKSPQNEIRGCP